MGNRQSPPLWARRLLAWYCRPELLEDLEGALHEYFTERGKEKGYKLATLYYWMDILTHCRPHTWKRLTTQNKAMMFGNHVKVSFRSIKKNRLNTSLNAIGLATGLASFILIMLWINKEMSFDRHHEKADRIYRVSNTFKSKAESFSQAPSGPALGAQLHKIFTEVENATRYFDMSMQMKIGNEVFIQPNVGISDPGFLEIFTIPLVSGNPATALQDPNSIILSESMVLKYFGNEEPIGKRIELADGALLQVNGVMKDVPENSQLHFTCLISMETMKMIWGSEDFDDNWGGGWFHTYLLLKENVDVPQLEADITAFIGEKLTSWAEQGMYYEYFLQPLTTIHLDSDLRYDHASNGSRQHVQIFSLAALLVLLLACINYVNIATANAIRKAKEVGIRKVMGSSRRSIIGQQMVETCIVMAISATLAVGLVYLLLPMLSELTGYHNLIVWTKENVLWFGGVLVIITLMSGFLPALMVSGFPLFHVLRTGIKRGSTLVFLRKSLVIFQFAATTVLLISMMVIQDQMNFVQRQSLGMKTSQVIHINFRGMQEVIEKTDVLRNELLSLPSIADVSFLNNSYPVNGLGNSGADVETADGSFVRSSIYTLRVDNHFASTFGLELLAGRFFSDEFPADSSQSVVVNEACMQNFGWGSPEDALGKKFGREPNQRQVIGVIRNFNFEALHKSVEPVRILPTSPSRYATLAVKITGNDPVRAITDVNATWDRIIQTVPLESSVMNEDIKRQYTAEYNFKTIFMIFGVLSVIIGCLGLFGLVTAAVHQRLKELSIRKVLGANVFQILILINRHFVILVIGAVIVASPIAFVLMRNWLENFSYHIDFSPLYILYALFGILLITVATISVNALKTAMTNPAEVLKDE